MFGMHGKTVHISFDMGNPFSKRDEYGYHRADLMIPLRTHNGGHTVLIRSIWLSDRIKGHPFYYMIDINQFTHPTPLWRAFLFFPSLENIHSDNTMYFTSTFYCDVDFPIIDLWTGQPNYAISLPSDYDSAENSKFGYKHKPFHLYNYTEFYRLPTSTMIPTPGHIISPFSQHSLNANVEDAVKTHFRQHLSIKLNPNSSFGLNVNHYGQYTPRDGIVIMQEYDDALYMYRDNWGPQKKQMVGRTIWIRIVFWFDKTVTVTMEEHFWVDKETVHPDLLDEKERYFFKIISRNPTPELDTDTTDDEEYYPEDWDGEWAPEPGVDYLVDENRQHFDNGWGDVPIWP